MAKRGYKLQEFVAHSQTVNCVSIGKKTCRHFITGGDDYVVNLWAIGNPTSLMSLCGHTSPIESVAFDSAEVLVLAGASTGVIKLWDLEEVKMVRTLSGHRSYCRAVEFHPFGDFFASGSMDTNLKIWDIRKKGCIQTYKGHTRGISNIKFTPDGRWVVSGGLDNTVKVWDLTAGKLLHDFKFHEGHIRSIDFHPLEFLLATGSADKTVKFWDLETFELIGSTRPEATGVRTITFHPDGRTLFCGLDDSLKVFSWEPVICHDAVEMGWSTLGDLCVHEGKLLGCSHFQNSVGVWVADISLIEPYAAGFESKENVSSEQKSGCRGNYLPDKVESGLRSTLGMRSISPDYEANDIKTIYVDSTGGNPVSSHPNLVLSSDSKKSSDVSMQKQGLSSGTHETDDGKTLNRSFVVPTIVPRASPDEKEPINSQRDSITSRQVDAGMLPRPAHSRKPSSNIYDAERLSSSAESENVKKRASSLDRAVDSNCQARLEANVDDRKSSGEKNSSLKNVAEKFGKILSPQSLDSEEKCTNPQNSGKETKSSVKFVNGVAVVRGRTRSLVERFERRELTNSNDDQTSSTCLRETPMTDKVSTMSPETNALKTDRTAVIVPVVGEAPSVVPEMDKAPSIVPEVDKASIMVLDRDRVSTTIPETNRESHMVPETDRASAMVPETDRAYPMVPETGRASPMVPETDRASTKVSNTGRTPSLVSEKNKKSTSVPQTMKSPTRLHAPNRRSTMSPAVARRSPTIPVRQRRSTMVHATDKTITMVPASDRSSTVTPDADKTSTIQSELPQISGADLTSCNDEKVTGDLLQTHEVFLSTLQSRLTKLQVVRHFWERRDIKGAIDAMRKLPDHSVQADVLSILMEKMEILTLDMFSCLLPVLVGLLDSRTERHVKISLDMLLKLVAVFGPVMRSSVSAPPPVGVDLHQEQRLECCNQCFIQLQKIQVMLPVLLRRGDLVAKSAQELNLVLQQS